MKKTNMLLIFIILVCFIGCEDKKSTENFPKHTFVVKSKELPQKITLSNQTLTLHDIQAPVVMINLFKPTCTSCIPQIKLFETLEKKYQKNLSILNIFKKSDTEDNIIFANALYRSLNIDIQTSLPLSIIYKHGEYYSHFEGATPIEMIRYDIQQAIQN